GNGPVAQSVRGNSGGACARAADRRRTTRQEFQSFGIGRSRFQLPKSFSGARHSANGEIRHGPEANRLLPASSRKNESASWSRVGGRHQHASVYWSIQRNEYGSCRRARVAAGEGTKNRSHRN